MVIIATGRIDYTSASGSLTTWTAVPLLNGSGTTIANKQMPAECTNFNVFDSGGSNMYWGIGDGTSGGTKIVAIMPPGGSDSDTHNQLSKGCNVWVKAIDMAATAGFMSVDFYHGRK